MQNRSYQEERMSASLVQSFFTQVYGWMFFGLLVTGALAYYTANSVALQQIIFSSKYIFYGLMIATLGLVFVLTGAINSLSSTTASFLFFVYSALNGLTMSVIFMVYTNESIASVFLITAGTFGAMSLFGYTTKADLSKYRNILFMGLIGLIIASIVNIFWANSTLDWILSYFGVALFVALTAYDTHRLKQLAYSLSEEGETMSKMAILGALTLYLDFINLFLYLLRIFGKRK